MTITRAAIAGVVALLCASFASPASAVAYFQLTQQAATCVAPFGDVIADIEATEGSDYVLLTDDDAKNFYVALTHIIGYPPVKILVSDVDIVIIATGYRTDGKVAIGIVSGQCLLVGGGTSMANIERALIDAGLIPPPVDNGPQNESHRNPWRS